MAECVAHPRVDNKITNKNQKSNHQKRNETIKKERKSRPPILPDCTDRLSFLLYTPPPTLAPRPPPLHLKQGNPPPPLPLTRHNMAGKRKTVAAADGSKKRARVAAAEETAVEEEAPAAAEEDGEWEVGSDFDDDSGSGSGEALQGFVTEADADADAEVDSETADAAEESSVEGDAEAPAAAPATSSAAAAAAPVRRSAVLLEGASVPKRKVRPVFATAEEAAEQEGLCDRMKFLQRWSKHFDAAWLKHTQSIGVGRDPGMQTPAELRRSLAVCMASLKKAKKIKVVRENKAWAEGPSPSSPAPATKKADKEKEDAARPTPDSAAAAAAVPEFPAAVDGDDAAAKEAERARRRVEGEERRRDKMKERREKKKQEKRSKKEAAAKEADSDELATLIHLGGGRVFDALEGRRRCLVLPDPLRPARVWFLQKRFRETGNAAPGREDRPRKRGGGAQEGEEELREVEEAEAGRVAVGNLPPGCVEGVQGAELLAVLARCGQLLDCEFQRAEEGATATACEAVYPSLQHARAACDALKGMPFGGRTLTAAVVRSEANARSKNMY